MTFIDQIIERLSKSTHFCFLDGYSDSSEIAVKYEDQEKITFTCPYGTYAYRRTSSGLCNAPATFKDACLLFFMAFVRNLWKYSWMISPSMELLLTIASIILTKFCRDVKRQILSSIGRRPLYGE